jgi:membrane dipeptidase
VRAQTKLVYADMHTHTGAAKLDLRDAMIRNRMLLITRTLSADRPVIRNEPGKGFRQIREPQPGELAAAFDDGIKRIRDDNRRHRLIEITDAAMLERMRGGFEPCVVLAGEGADFLDGDLKRLEAARAQGIVHVQLVHYRVSEVGDISTEMPVHGGLTAFGKDVVRACNRLGILVDVAHATHEGMAQALDISTKPVIYSHGHVISSAPYWTNNANRARAISSSMAKRIAERGGVVGIWTPVTQYRSLDAYAAALADTAALLGPAHVGVGTDMAGLPAGSIVPSYDEFALLDDALAKRGASAADIAAILGGNYLRVLSQALTP